VWLRGAARRRAILAAACTGVFLLGDAGALDGRRCTTTWWLSGLLARRCPAARVDADAIVLEDHGVWTAGAMISQLDLMMALIERFCGAALAHETRRRLAAPRRVSQAPYIAAGSLATGDRELAAFESFVAERLKSAIALDDAARALRMSTRTLARRIRAATGLSPSRLIQKIRLGGALNLIERTRLPLDRVAESVGLADATVLHRLVVRHTGQSPGRFRGGGSAARAARDDRRFIYRRLCYPPAPTSAARSVATSATASEVAWPRSRRGRPVLRGRSCAARPRR
jgi:transcriptional regulator GlxA family with amidase domain